MNLGIFASLNNTNIAAKAGCEYIEQGLNGLVAKSENDMQQYLEELSKINLPCDAFNCFFPGTIRFGIKNPDYAQID